MIYAVIALIFALVFVVMVALIVSLYINNVINEDARARLEERLVQEKSQGKDLEYMVYSLEHKNDMLNVELENQRQLCDIFEETADIYKKRVVFLEKIIEKENDVI